MSDISDALPLRQTRIVDSGCPEPVRLWVAILVSKDRWIPFGRLRDKDIKQINHERTIQIAISQLLIAEVDVGITITKKLCKVHKNGVKGCCYLEWHNTAVRIYNALWLPQCRDRGHRSIPFCQFASGCYRGCLLLLCLSALGATHWMDVKGNPYKVYPDSSDGVSLMAWGCSSCLGAVFAPFRINISRCTHVGIWRTVIPSCAGWARFFLCLSWR